MARFAVGLSLCLLVSSFAFPQSDVEVGVQHGTDTGIISDLFDQHAVG